MTQFGAGCIQDQESPHVNSLHCLSSPSRNFWPTSLLADQSGYGHKFSQNGDFVFPVHQLMTLEPGTQLGPYRILALIGAGAMGEVYKALDTKLEREVAVKVLPRQLADQGEFLGRFEREAKAVAALSHPNILGIFDIGQEGEIHYAAMELLEGESLRAAISAGPMPPKKALELAHQMALGLAAAHDKGITHRDLKPENLFITRDGRLKILDFGLAKRAPRSGPISETAVSGSQPMERKDTVSTISGTLLGTVGYMSPEQARGEAVDQRSDIFSFGLVLYEMLSGRQAFQRPSAPEILAAIIRDEPEPPGSMRGGLPPALERTILHCLEKRPEARSQSMRDVAFDLESAMGSGFRVPVVAGFFRATRRRWAIGASVVALLVAGSFSLWFMRGHTFGPAPQPLYKRVSFRQGQLHAARFTPDGGGVVYSAAWGEEPYRLFTSRLDNIEDRPLGLENAQLLGISSKGELALGLHCEQPNIWIFRGTLARSTMDASAPREMLPGVEWADWSPSGEPAVVRYVEGRWRVEYPIGQVRAETTGWFSHLRFSPAGNALAYLEHPIPNDDAGRVCLLDLASGKTRRLTKDWSSANGLAWKGREIWFSAAEDSIDSALYAVGSSGEPRLALRIPGALYLHDIALDGHMLVSLENQRTGILFLKDKEVRDLSWRTWSYLWALSADGSTVLFDEEGESSGPDYDLFLRRTDGSPAVMLGRGAPSALSPDGKWVATVLRSPQPHVALLRTGPGEARSLPAHGIDNYFSMAFTPDGRNLIYSGGEAGKGSRVFLQDLDGGQARPLTPEGTTLPLRGAFLSPDGRHFLARGHEGPALWDLEAPERPPTAVKGLQDGQWVLQWTPDLKRILVYRPGRLPIAINVLDPATGLQTPWRTVAPAGYLDARLDNARLTPDGTTLVTNYRRRLSTLFVMEGVK